MIETRVYLHLPGSTDGIQLDQPKNVDERSLQHLIGPGLHSQTTADGGTVIYRGGDSNHAWIRVSRVDVGEESE
jgi:hypothetical protein